MFLRVLSDFIILRNFGKNIYIYECMYVCMYVCMFVCIPDTIPVLCSEVLSIYRFLPLLVLNVFFVIEDLLQ